MGVVVRYLYEHAKTGELVYRRTIPAKLRGFAGRSQVRRFLGSTGKSDPGVTDRLADAQRDYEETVRRAALAAEAERRATEGNFTELTPSIAEYLIHNAKAVLLEDDEWARWQPKSPSGGDNRSGAYARAPKRTFRSFGTLALLGTWTGSWQAGVAPWRARHGQEASSLMRPRTLSASFAETSTTP